MRTLQKLSRQESCDLSLFKPQNCSWNVFLCSSQMQWIQLKVYMPLWKAMFLPCVTCPCDCTQLKLRRTLLGGPFLSLRV